MRNSISERKTLFDKNKFLNYINNSNNANFLASNRIDFLKNKIKNNSINKSNQFNMIKRYQTFNSPKNLKTLNRNNNLTTYLNSDPFSLNDKHFVRKFEDLFKQATNNNIKDYYNGEEIEKMDDFVKGIKEFNYIDFMKKLKNRKIKNKKSYNNYKPRNFSSKQNIYKGCSFGKTPNNNDNFSDNNLNSISTDGNTQNNFGYDLNNYSFKNLKPSKNYCNTNYNNCFGRNDCKYNLYNNEIDKINLLEDKKKYRNFSLNSTINRNELNDFILKYRTKRNLYCM